MPSINKCVVFLSLALSVFALGDAHHDARSHRGMARHVLDNRSPEVMLTNPLKKRATRSNSKRCKASEEFAKSTASVASASSSKAAAASSSSKAAAASSSSKAAAAAASSKAAEKKKEDEQKAAPPAPKPTKSSGGSVGNLISGGMYVLHPHSFASYINYACDFSATFFSQNGVAGACGKVHSDNDVVAALQTDTFAGGSHCGKTVSITNTKTGKTVDVLVADEVHFIVVLFYISASTNLMGILVPNLRQPPIHRFE